MVYYILKGNKCSKKANKIFGLNISIINFKLGKIRRFDKIIKDFYQLPYIKIEVILNSSQK